MLGAVEGSDSGDGEGALEGLEGDGGETGGWAGDGRVACIVHQHLEEAEGENPLEGLADRLGVGAVDADGKHLRLRLAGDVLRQHR